MKDIIGFAVLALATIWLLCLIFTIVRDVLSDRKVAKFIKERDRLAAPEAGAGGGKP